MSDTGYPGRTRLEVDRTRRVIGRIAESWELLDLGDFTNGDFVEKYGTFTFGMYATGGVSVTGATGALSVSMDPWVSGGGVLRHFKWNAGTNKMMVADPVGNEVAALTDLSAISGWPWRAVFAAARTPARECRLAGSGRITSVEFEVSSAFTLSASDYWTIHARLRHMDAARPEPNGATIGSYSTVRRSLVAQTPVVLYDAERGLEFHDSDRVLVTAVATGDPLPMLGARAWVRVARSVQ